VFASAPIGPNEKLASCPFVLAITQELATKAICELLNKSAEELVWEKGEWNARMRICAYIGLHWVWKEKGLE
jgi:hypothetical protein